MALTLYELSEEMKAAEEAIMAYAEEHDGDITECPFNEILEKLEGEKEQKCLNIAAWYKNLIGEAKAIEAEKKTLYAREKANKNKAERLKNYIEEHIKPGTKLSDSRIQIGWRKSEQVFIEAEPDTLPPQYQRVSIEPDKTKIKEELKKGADLPFASLITKQNLQIK